MSAKVPIHHGQRWTYVGPNGRKALHTVVLANSSEVITFSDPFQEADAGGESWLGRPEEFKRTFIRCNSCE